MTLQWLACVSLHMDAQDKRVPEFAPPLRLANSPSQGNLILNYKPVYASTPWHLCCVSLCQLGGKLIEQYGHVRYVEYIWHNGRQWTTKTDWERIEDGEWVVIELPQSNY